jgi:Xaa-Pro aminopeptidase
MSGAHAQAPRIAARAFPERRARLVEALAADGIDGFIAYGDDRQFGGANHIRYLTGFEPHFEPVFLAVRGERAIVLSGAETLGLATNSAPRDGLEAILAIRELAYPGLEYATIPLAGGVELLRGLFEGAGRVALLAGGSIGVDDHAAVVAPLRDHVDLVDGDAHAYRGRAIKSEAEHRAIDEAYQVAAAGMRAVVETLAPGVTEREVAAEAERAMRRAGAEGFTLASMVGSGPNSASILCRTTSRRIEAGDLVAVTLGPRCEGYCVSFARPFVIDEPRDPEVVRAIETGWRSLEVAAELLSPGVAGARATRAARAVVADAGVCATLDEVWVHSMGLVEFEPPFLGPGSDALLEPGMAISIDVPLFHAPWGGLRIEDGYEITADGARERIAGSHDAFPWRI